MTESTTGDAVPATETPPQVTLPAYKRFIRNFVNGTLPADFMYWGAPHILNTTYHPTPSLWATSTLTGLLGSFIASKRASVKERNDIFCSPSICGGLLGTFAGIGLYSAVSIYNPGVEIRELSKPEPKKVEPAVSWQERFTDEAKITTASSWMELAEMARQAKLKPAERGVA